MAKKRVHEIAKERGIPSKEVIAALQAAGHDVKVAASSVDVDVANRALDGGGEEPAPPAEAPAAASSASGSAATGTETKPSRPSDSSSSDASRKRRRVVIDSQASRRDQAGPPPPQRPPRRRGGRRRRPLLEEPPVKAEPEEHEEQLLKVHSGATVKEVAEIFGVPAPEVIKNLMGLGEMATLTQTLTDEAIGLLAEEFSRKVEMVTAGQEEQPSFEGVDDAADVTERPPVVTIMGHVDHGKTSLLDAIREADVAESEAGGITQHIGAYQVRKNEKLITFIDTPGHQAFTAMRARGAGVTDIAIIVVAADDGLMPQTKEAIDHARAAEVPMIVAVNKVDLENADPQRVRGELAAENLTPEDWGGETVFCDVSAKTGEGLDTLLEMILLVSEVEELRANPDADASGTVVESRLDPGRGPVVGMLVRRGTLNVGDSLVSGPVWGRVRAMQDHTGKTVEVAGPSTPVEILGFDGVAEAGEFVQAVANDRDARRQAADRANRLKTEALARRQARRVTLDEVFSQVREGQLKELNLVVKADVAGSVEALLDELAKLPQDDVTVSVIHSAAGGINESDVMLAAASDALIIGWNVRPLADARRAAEQEGVEIRTYSVIYKITEELRAAMEGLLEPEEVEDAVGELEVRQTFRSSRAGTIAGCFVSEGRVYNDSEVRLLREGRVIWTGRVGGLRRFKDEVREVDSGLECGVTLDGYDDIKDGDVIEAFASRLVERTLS
ncbi:MAG: translation initiation factor IF-2 [Solirubrobacterales bacterium]